MRDGGGGEELWTVVVVFSPQTTGGLMRCGGGGGEQPREMKGQMPVCRAGAAPVSVTSVLTLKWLVLQLVAELTAGDV